MEDCVPWTEKYCSVLSSIFLFFPHWRLQVHFPYNLHQEPLLLHSNRPAQWTKSHATLGWALKSANKSCLSPHSPNTALSGPSMLNTRTSVEVWEVEVIGNHLLKIWISMLSIRMWKQRWRHLIWPECATSPIDSVDPTWDFRNFLC